MVFGLGRLPERVRSVPRPSSGPRREAAAPLSPAALRSSRGLAAATATALQSQTGNRATADMFRRTMVMQRTSQASQLQPAAVDVANALRAMTTGDLLDTTFDPRFGKRKDLAAILGELGGAGGAHAQAAVRAVNGPYDEPFYYSLGLLDAGFRSELWDRLAKSKPNIANPTARTGAIASAFMGLCRGGAFGQAMSLVGKYSMPDIVDILMLGEAAGMLRTLDAHWADATGIDVPRLRAAVSAIRAQPVLHMLQQSSIAVGDPAAKVLSGELDNYEKDLDDAITSPTTDPRTKAHCQTTKSAIGEARVSLAQLSKDAGLLTPVDLGVLNGFLKAGAGGDFSRVIDAPNAHSQGQFVLSAAVDTELWDLLNGQLAKLTGLTAEQTAKLQGATDKLTSALQDVYVGSPAASYQSVLKASAAFRQQLLAMSKLRGVAVAPEVTDALKVALPPPPAKGSYAKVIQAVWAPMWQEWLRTKSFPNAASARNVFKLAYLRMADQWACQPMALKLAELYDAKATGADVRAKDPKYAFGSINLYRTDRGPNGTVTVTDPTSKLVSETVLYKADLAANVAKMKAALDHGWFIHVRVLSGARMEHTASRQAGEHSLLVVGYRGNAFLCSDTDPGGEGAHHLTTGYTGLFYDAAANTLGSGIGPGLEVNDRGYQPNHRHRYQAWTINTK